MEELDPASMTSPFWTPSPEAIRASNMDGFRRFVNAQYKLDFKEGDFWPLHQWSIDTPETINDFYNAIWDFGGVIGDKGAQPVSRLPAAIQSIELTRSF